MSSAVTDPRDPDPAATPAGNRRIGGGGAATTAPRASAEVALEDAIARCKGVEALFELVQGIHDRNAALAAKIDAAADKRVKYYEYSAPPVVNDDGDGCTLKLTAEEVEAPAGELVAAWKVDHDIKLIELFDMVSGARGLARVSDSAVIRMARHGFTLKPAALALSTLCFLPRAVQPQHLVHVHALHGPGAP